MFTKIKKDFKKAGLTFKLDSRGRAEAQLRVKFPDSDKFIPASEWGDVRAIARIENLVAEDADRSDVIRAAEQIATTYDPEKKANVYPTSRSR